MEMKGFMLKVAGFAAGTGATFFGASVARYNSLPLGICLVIAGAATIGIIIGIIIGTELKNKE